ncbi:unnamed protein product [Calypogeia fissa]
MEGRPMFFAPLEPQWYGEAYYHDTYSNYRLEMPERKQNRKGKLSMKLMRIRLILPRVRIRILSPVHLYEKMRDSYLRLVLAHRKPDQAAVSPYYQYHSEPSYSSDAIAECIEFVKKSSVNQESVLIEKIS